MKDSIVLSFRTFAAYESGPANSSTEKGCAGEAFERQDFDEAIPTGAKRLSREGLWQWFKQVRG